MRPRRPFFASLHCLRGGVRGSGAGAGGWGGGGGAHAVADEETGRGVETLIIELRRKNQQ
jgi:hypothetical protein